MFDSTTRTVVVVGSQWGDEGKGKLVDVLAERAGRVLWRQWPTGVSVTDAQQHGGPYPASTTPQATSVGSAAIARFLRPVALQGFPSRLLPAELVDATTAASQP